MPINPQVPQPARRNLRSDLVKAGIKDEAANLLQNLFDAMAAQINSLIPPPFEGVKDPYGIGQYPVASAPQKIAKGMLVRTSPTGLIPATSVSGDSRTWANAFVMGVIDNVIWVAAGASSAPLMVVEPVQGQKVMVLRGGMGTCSAVSETGDLQGVATCEVNRPGENGLCQCSNVSFQIPINQILDGRYLERNVDNQILPTPPNASTGFTGSSSGYLMALHNTGAGGGWLIECDGGSSVTAGLRITTLLSKGGVQVDSQSGACFSGSNFSVGPAAAFQNTDTASGSFHLLLGDQGTTAFNGIDVLANTIRFYGNIAADTLTLTPTNSGSWGTLTQTLQAASGTIPLLEIAQTWTALQTFQGGAASTVSTDVWFSAVADAEMGASAWTIQDTRLVASASSQVATFGVSSRLRPGTIITHFLAVFGGAAPSDDGITHVIQRRQSSSPTTSWTDLYTPQTVLGADPTLTTYAIPSPITLAAGYTYRIRVESVVGDAEAYLYDVAVRTTRRDL